MDTSVSLPLDSDGFLRRECPHCEQQFKWHHGPANEEAETLADPLTYFCPLCGEPAGHDAWWTKEQLAYSEGAAAPALMRYVLDELAGALRGNKNITFKPGNGSDMPDVPASLTEPDDMRIVASPCHGYEPVKVPDNPSDTLHCLLCGNAFAV